MADASPAWLLALLLVALVSVTWNDRRDYARFKTLTATAARQACYRRWLVVAVLVFTVGGLAALAVLGRLDALWRFPVEFQGVIPASVMNGVARALPWAGLGVCAGIVLAVLARRRDPGRVVVVGDIEPMLPRNAAERVWAGLLGTHAGLGEELYFRLVIPLLIALLTGEPVVAFVATIVIFGVVHAYQGLAGVIGTTLVGVVMTIAYLVTETLAVPVALHALMNLNALVLTPWQMARRAASGDT